MSKVLFLPPNASRLRALVRELGANSLLRSLQYERCSTLGLIGDVLDFGGGDRSHYSTRLLSWSKGNIDYKSVNIDKTIDPTVVIGISEDIPFPDEAFDLIISLNTFEHIFDTTGTLRRVRRVLRPLGTIFIAVPYLFRVHGHPNDYVRGTPSFWQRQLTEAGFDDIVVEAQVWGPFSTGAVASGQPGPFKKARLICSMVIDLLYWTLRRKDASGPHYLEQDGAVVNSALGYFITARKTSESA